MSTHHHYELAPDVVMQAAEGEALLVKLSAEDIFALNQTGAEIVGRLSAGESLETLVTDLVQTYDAPADDVARDVEALVAALVARGLVRERTVP